MYVNFDIAVNYMRVVFVNKVLMNMSLNLNPWSPGVPVDWVYRIRKGHNSKIFVVLIVL